MAASRAGLWPATGQRRCFDPGGNTVPCRGTGQDGELRRGRPWPEPRFAVDGGLVEDRYTGLVWPRNAAPAEFPLTWPEALDWVQRARRDAFLGHDDWRLPNRRELRSLVSHEDTRPALPPGHPFEQVFAGWYWTGTTAAGAPAHAWYVDLYGGRMFFGGKDQSFMVLPVRGSGNGLLARTGQHRCYDSGGVERPCPGSGQDGEYRCGRPWPEPRLRRCAHGIEDRLTGLVWMPPEGLPAAPLSWAQALEVAGRGGWRLPNILELESLVDCQRARPGLVGDLAAPGLAQGYWSATTSVYEPDWAWVLYPEHGAVGVGQKAGRWFGAWPVRDA